MSNTTKTVIAVLAVIVGVLMVGTVFHLLLALVSHLIPIVVLVGLGYLAVHFVRRKALGSSERRSLP
jgi:uncharacterized protein YacL